MDRYWAKIGVGALAIFGVGMTGVTLAKKGVHELKTVAAGRVVEAIQQSPSRFLTFRLDGRRIGQVRTIEVSNDGEWNAHSVAMKVDLSEGREPDDLGECALAADDLRYRRDASFRCVSEDDIGDENLTQIGEVTFAPAGVTRPLYLGARQLRDLNRSELRGLKATLKSDDGRRVAGDAHFDVMTDHGRERGTVKLDAADGRANIEIRGEDGRELFSLRADGRGVSINAKDKRGSNLLKLLAGDAGVHVDVSSDERKAEKDSPEKN